LKVWIQGLGFRSLVRRHPGAEREEEREGARGRETRELKIEERVEEGSVSSGAQPKGAHKAGRRRRSMGNLAFSPA
jgi:hypothetical protein